MTGRDDGLSLDAAQGAGGVAQYTAQYIAVKSVAMVRRRRHYLVDRSHAYLQWRWHPARSAASLYGLAGATGWLAADRGRQWQQRWHGRRTAAFHGRLPLTTLYVARRGRSAALNDAVALGLRQMGDGSDLFMFG